MTIKLHKKIQGLVNQLKRLETQRDDVSQERYLILEKRVDRLQRQYRSYHGFNYNPLFYEGRAR